MRHDTTYAALFTASLLLAACGGADSGGADTGAEAEAAGAGEAMGTTADLSCYLQGATADEAEQRPSPLEQTTFTFEGGQGLLCYGAPSARGREMVGGVDPYGQPWRTGANEATAIHLSAPATIGGVSLDAGSYSLYTIPSEDQWEVFINSNWQRWGIPISDEVRATDVGSFTVTPEPTDGHVETLTFSFEPNADGTGGDIVMEWEDTRLRIPVSGGGM